MDFDKDTLCKEFELVLSDVTLNENHVQTFLESNSAMIPLPFLLNHRLHFNSIITKFPISTSLTCDFLYITKSTDHWWIVLVELENQKKKIFTNDKKNIYFSSEFNHAYDQITSWRAYINQNQKEFKESLSILFEPIRMAKNPIYFKYVLVLGRNSEKKTQNHINMFDQKNKDDIKVITYDTVMSSFNYNPYPEAHVILSKNGTGFKVKNLQDAEVPLFGALNPSELELSKEQKDYLIKEGYDMEAWEKGEYLVVNHKLPSSRGLEILKLKIAKHKSKK